MKSFKDHSTTTQSTQTAQPTQAESLNAEELTAKLTSAFEGKSDLEMLKNILYEAEKSKRAGTLTNEELEEFYTAFSPMLDGFQRKTLRMVVDKLKQL